MNPIVMILLIAVPMITVMVISIRLGKKQKLMNEQRSKDILTMPMEDIEKKYKPTQKKISKMIGMAVLIPILSTAFILIFSLGGCSSDATISVLVLEKENQKYVYHSNSFFVKNDIENGNVVDISFYSKLTVYPLKKGIFVDPKDLQAIASFATGQFEILEYDQGSHAGFVIDSDSSLYNEESKAVPTDKIGKTVRQETIIISDGQKELLIEYQRDGADEIPIRNCEIKSVWEVTNPYPGKTVGNYRDKLLVNATEVLRYFNPNAQMELIDDGEVLLVRID